VGAFRQVLDLQQPSLALGALPLTILTGHINAQAIGSPGIEVVLNKFR